MALDRESITASLVEAKIGASPSRSELLRKLSRALNVHDLEVGVLLDFSTNQPAFNETIEVLELDKLIKDKKPLHIHQAIVSTFGQHSFIGSAIPALSRLPLSRALEVLQADRWKTQTGYGGETEIRLPTQAIFSEIILMHTSELDENNQATGDATKPAALLRVASYAGVSLIGEYGDDFGVEHDLDEFIGERDKREKRHEIVADLANYIADNGFGLSLPLTRYSLSIGKPTRGPSILPNVGGVDTNLHVEI